MSLPRYGEYKDSGENDLGELPSHWIITRFSRIMNALKDGTHGTFQRVEEGLPLLSAKNVLAGHLQFGDSESLISQMDHTEIVASGFPAKGDVLLTIVGTIGRSCVYQFDYPMAFQRSVCFIRLMLGHSQQFIYYFTQSKFFQEQLVARSKSSAQAGVYMGDVAATTIAFPPNILEQTSIAAFLDCETAKIDALIAEQEKLIALLAEKRQATISHAVTRGLNPNAPMKDSGVAWLGEVPAHWKFKRIKHIKAEIPNAFVDGRFGSNLKSEHFIENGDVFVIESNFATQNKIDEGELKTISHAHFETIARSEVSANDIVIAKIGAQFGKASILPQLSKRAVVSGNSLKLTVNPNLCLNNWAYFQLVNLKSVGEIDLLANGSAQPALSLGGMNNLPVVTPPLNEQIEILKFIASGMDKLDSLKVDAERSIELLKERRSALIAAAVTGQIDVRGLVEPQPS